MSQVKELLTAIEAGDGKAASELLPLVYTELRRLAEQRLAKEQPGQTMQATDLVHEAYLRLVGPANADGFANRKHFFAAAAEAMRRILVEKARRKRQRCEIDFGEIAIKRKPEELLGVHEALDSLAAKSPAVAELVKLRYFVGFTLEEAAQALDISLRTANNHWNYAKAWLKVQLADDFEPRPSGSGEPRSNQGTAC